MSPHVLVVEDEFFSRLHAADLVEAAGYRAIEASNADEAIAIFSRSPIVISRSYLSSKNLRVKDASNLNGMSASGT